MENLIPTTITALIALAGTVFAAIVSFILGQRKSVAESAKLLANGYSSLVDDQREEIKVLRELTVNLQAQVVIMMGRIDVLETEVKRLRIENGQLGRAAEQMRTQLTGV